ncbi:MAG: type IX secretion system membrane protein PorP/SprF [Bacteroidales bacterium]|nr:type IX secretion system membrane protein PorP/SprF [Bacteroidales bacterium]
MNKITFKMPRKILVIAIALSSAIARGQQDPGFSQYMYNTISVNSAYAGTKDAINIILLSRHQWVGFEGAPQTQTATIHGPTFIKYVGLGLSYVHDKIGPLNINTIYIDYSFKFKIHEGGKISLGLKTGLDMRKNDLSHLTPLNESDPTYSKDIISKVSPNIGVGIYYYTDRYYLGFSVPKIRNTYLDEEHNAQLEQGRLERHYFIIGGYVWTLNREWKIKPSFLVKHVKGAPLSVDLNFSAMYRERIIAGISHRFGDSFGALVQVRAFDYLWFGYAYDFTVTNLRKYNYGTHEILLLLDLYPPKDEVVKSPRFF